MRANLPVHAGLFAATCATTVWAGKLAYGTWAAGASFGGALMLILLCHELGHYVVARRHGLPVSLPYFVPLPPQISLGTLGAVIRMERPISDRNQLIDVGAAGPLAGLAVALPLLAWGLSRSPIEPIASGAYLEGNSLLYIGIKYAVTGQYLPAADGTDVTLGPVAFAAWVGLLITMINLIPIGQLDGGHVACSYLGDRHERSSRWLHRGLVATAIAVTAALAWEAAAAGRGPWGALAHGARGGVPWLVWAGILAVMRSLGGAYHPPVSGPPLTRGRRVLVACMVVVFALIFTPVPLRPAL